MRSSLLFFTCLMLITARAIAEPTAMDRLAACMIGTFSSADQARGDKNFRDVTLHVIPIWTGRTDGPWLYLEQALTDAPDHPHRQHICQLATRADGSIESRVFELPDPIAATNAWKDSSLLSNLKPTDLLLRDGCTLILRIQPDGSFMGGTEGKGCLSTLRGASYATTEVTFNQQQTITWERGYNASNAQVWGSIHGGYIFKKQ